MIMKKFKKFYIILISLMTAFYGCQENNYQFGEIIAPSNIVLTAEIVGQDLNDPALINGDGSGIVNFTATADNASSYVYYFNGVAELHHQVFSQKDFLKLVQTHIQLL
tara:strand:+ start:1264 stop:1587 length:324 start_codon:yes stop_codon:yes gene_type:complete